MFCPRCLLCVAVILLLYPSAAQAQQIGQVSGQVVDSATGEPIAGVNVFLDETTRGAATGDDGRYTIRNIPPGTYRLVASMIGFEPVEERLVIEPGSARQMDFELGETPLELEGLTVTEDRSEWLRQLDRFKDQFLGRVSNRRHVELTNPEVLHFETDEESGAFIARAEEPLEMVNEALGYRVIFPLDEMRVEGSLTLTNLSARFYELEPESEQQAREWTEAREEAYRGSFMHFIRVLSRDRFEEAGFRLHLTQVRAYDSSSNEQELGSRVHSKADITRSGGRDTGITLSFRENYLSVEYVRAREDHTYPGRFRSLDWQGGENQLSWIEMPAGRAVLDQQSGLSFPPYTAIMHGYWNWRERAPNMLPSGYEPGMPIAYRMDAKRMREEYTTEHVGDVASIQDRLRGLVQQRGQLTASIDAGSALALGADRGARGDLQAELRAYRSGIQSMQESGRFYAELVDTYVRSVFRARAEDEYAEASRLYLKLLEKGPARGAENDMFARHVAQMAFLLPEEFVNEGEELQPGDGPRLAGWWRREDPEPATADNARLTEHLERVVEAEARFGNRRFAAGFDDRGKVYVRLGEPTRTEHLQSRWLERSVQSDASFIPTNTYWIYGDVAHEAQYLFVEERGGFRIGETRDLLPASMRNRSQMPYTGLLALRDFYNRIATFNAEYGSLARDVEAEYEEFYHYLIRKYGDEQAMILVNAQDFLDWEHDDPTQSHEWTMPLLLNQIRQTDRAVAQRREEVVPRTHSKSEPDAMPLPVETRVARFLEEDGTTRTEVYWAPEPGGLDPAAELPELAAQAARDFVLESMLVQYGSTYSRSDISREDVLLVEQEDTGANATIPVQSFVVPKQEGVHHLALQLNQRLASGEAAVGPAVKQTTVRIDSLRALASDQRVLEMSDLRPMILPDLESEVQLAQMAPDEMRRLAFPFRKLPGDVPLALFFEVYHLTFGEDDRTRYTVEYEIHRQTEQGWLRTLLEGEDEQQTMTALEREGTGSRAEELIVIDLSAIEDKQDVQQLRLTVRVIDELTGQAQERHLEFETIVPEE